MKRSELTVGQHVVARVPAGAGAYGYYSDGKHLCTVLDLRRWSAGNIYDTTQIELESGHHAKVRGVLADTGRSVVLGLRGDWPRLPLTRWEGDTGRPTETRQVFLASPAAIELPTRNDLRRSEVEQARNARHLKLCALGLDQEAADLHECYSENRETLSYSRVIDKLIRLADVCQCTCLPCRGCAGPVSPVS